jgi:hypothetical protein
VTYGTVKKLGLLDRMHHNRGRAGVGASACCGEVASAPDSGGRADAGVGPVPLWPRGVSVDQKWKEIQVGKLKIWVRYKHSRVLSTRAQVARLEPPWARRDTVARTGSICRHSALLSFGLV